MLVSAFDYDLPEELIAQQPPTERGRSRMLTLDRQTGNIADRRFTELPELLQPGDLLVLNDSRVLPARLFATRAGLHTQPGSAEPSGRIEVLLTEQLPNTEGHNDWRALVRPARKVQPGEHLLFNPSSAEPAQTLAEPLLEAEVLQAGEFGERTLRFAPTSEFYTALDRIGFLPLPPYIHRDKAQPNTAADRERYQTIFSTPLMQQNARYPTQGSAAAPTAGLHFTPAILNALQSKGIEIARLTLHVGLGTFQPVRVADTRDIRLHAEPYTLPANTAATLNIAWREGRRIIAVGTTVTRTLEHLARRFEAAQGALDRSTHPLHLEPHTGSTSLFLSPTPDGDAAFKLVRGLLTNFHLPQSTLLMLVSAFAGREAVLRAYEHSVGSGYRFFSYGDCMLIA